MSRQLFLFDYSHSHCFQCDDFKDYPGCSLGKCLRKWKRRINPYIAKHQGCQEMERRVQEDIAVHERMKKYQEARG